MVVGAIMSGCDDAERNARAEALAAGKSPEEAEALARQARKDYFESSRRVFKAHINLLGFITGPLRKLWQSI